MIWALELTTDELNRIRNVEARGINVNAIMKNLIAAFPEPDIKEQYDDGTVALLEQWRKEAANLTPAEIAEDERELNDFKLAMNANRIVSGEEPVYYYPRPS